MVPDMLSGSGGMPCTPAITPSGKREIKLAMRHSIISFFAASVFALAAFSPAEGQSAAQTIAPSSGKALCSALTPADFTRAGVLVSGLSQANLDGANGAYCVYASKAGSVELDIFFPAGATPVEISATEKTVLGEMGYKSESVQIAGADNAQIVLAAGTTSSMVVRKGKAVFAVNIPRSANSRQQLLALAQIVLGRLKQ